MDMYNIENYFKRGKTVILTLRQGTEDNITGRLWPDKDSHHLIVLMKEFMYEFGNPKRRKKDVWVDVSRKMLLTDSNWTPEDCRKKWSNMIRTFKTVEEQRRGDGNTPNKKIKWPFYEQISELLSLDGADSLPEAASVLATTREYSTGANEPQPSSSAVYQNNSSSDASHAGELVPTLTEIEMHNEEAQESNAQTVEASIDTEQMQFYIVDNHEGVRTSAEDPTTTVTFTASTEDFQTLATVAAAAAASSSDTESPSSSQALMKQVKFADQIISVPSSAAPSLLAIPADINSTGLTTVVSIPIAQYAGQLQAIQPRVSVSAPTPTITIGRACEVDSHVDSSASPSLPSSSQVRTDTVTSTAPKKAMEPVRKKRKVLKHSSPQKKSNSGEDSTGDPMLDKFIAISSKQSERILERIETFQRETLQVMRERNKLLENIFEFLKSQANAESISNVDSASTSAATGSSSSVSDNPLNAS